MRTQFGMKIVPTGLLVMAALACGDLTVQPRSTVTDAALFTDPASYRAFLAKLYAGLAVTGQEGPAGNADIQGIDEGFSQYVRGYWQLQQLPTDEVIIGWGDTGLPELNTQLWSASNPFIGAMFSRIFYQVALANQFLRADLRAGPHAGCRLPGGGPIPPGTELLPRCRPLRRCAPRR